MNIFLISLYPDVLLFLLVVLPLVGLFIWVKFFKKPKGYVEPPKDEEGNVDTAYNPESGKLRPAEDRSLKLEVDDFVTPKGIRVRCEPKAKQFVGQEVLKALDDGIDEGIEIARDCQGHPIQVQHSQIVVTFLESQLAPESKLPAYRVPAAQYKGTKYDLGGYVLAAGQLIIANRQEGVIIAVPAPITGDLATVSRVTYYEYEHGEDSFYDVENFQKHVTHEGGKGHPIWHNCKIGSLGFAGSSENFICGEPVL
jgi:hypothetical protein